MGARRADRAPPDWSPRTVLVTGAGPIGLLAALLGVKRGLDVRVLDRVTDGPKPQLVADLGASYHTDLHEIDADSDIVIECTGVGTLVVDVMERNAHNAVVGLTGVSALGRSLSVDVGELPRRCQKCRAPTCSEVQSVRMRQEYGGTWSGSSAGAADSTTLPASSAGKRCGLSSTERMRTRPRRRRGGWSAARAWCW